MADHDNLPAHGKNAFICPFCKAFAYQEWELFAGEPRGYLLQGAKCFHCRKVSIWYERKMIVPGNTGLPAPNKDMPSDVKVLYEEAAQVYNISRRASLALLRLAIDNLTIDLSMDIKSNLFQRIGILKSNRIISDRIQQVFDYFRVIGNDAVHPGQIDIKDNIDHSKLFYLLNYIVDTGITKPKEIENLFNEIPMNQKESIIKRDSINQSDKNEQPHDS